MLDLDSYEKEPAETKVKILEKECLSLAAHQCQFPGSGDGGDAYCVKIKELEKTIKYLLSIVKMAKETGELWLNDQDWNKIESLNTKP